MVGRKDCGSGSDDGADGVVHGLALGALDCALERGALSREGRLGLRDGDCGVFGKVVVMVGGSAYDWASLGRALACKLGACWTLLPGHP